MCDPDFQKVGKNSAVGAYLNLSGTNAFSAAMEFISNDILTNARTYPQYRALVSGLLAKEKATGLLQTPALVEYSRLNDQRMNRLDKTFNPDPSAQSLLEKINQPLLWLTISEGWCGDAGQIAPVLNGLALQNPGIQLRFILRDEYPGIMDAFLTNGSRSIPKVLFVHPETRRVLDVWGPRPAEAQALMATTKADMLALKHDDLSRKTRYEAGQTAMHSWYARDRTVSIQREVTAAAVGCLKKLDRVP
jgi:hypothetical protein